MKIQIEQAIQREALDDINYLLEIILAHNTIEDAMSKINTTNFPHLGIGQGSSHIWVKQCYPKTFKLNTTRTLLITE